MGVPGTDLQGWKWVRGRAPRREYWLWLAGCFAWTALLGEDGGAFAQIVLSIAVALQVFRRLHDLGLSGWWYPALLVIQIALFAGFSGILSAEWAALISVAPLFLGAVALGVIPGDRQPNRFGSPQGPAPAQTSL